jgi:hypothetical protein
MSTQTVLNADYTSISIKFFSPSVELRKIFLCFIHDAEKSIILRSEKMRDSHMVHGGESYEKHVENSL